MYMFFTGNRKYVILENIEIYKSRTNGNKINEQIHTKETDNIIRYTFLAEI